MFQVAVIELGVPVSRPRAGRLPSQVGGAGYTFFSALNIKLQLLRLYGKLAEAGRQGGPRLPIRGLG